MPHRHEVESGGWDDFDPEAYCEHNYSRVWPEDDAIVHRLAMVLPDLMATHRHVAAVDLGAGSNLYPALAVLPYIDSIDLCDVGSKNLQWLRNEAKGFDDRWDKYWELTATTSAPHREILDPRAALAERAKVVERSIFDSPEARYDLGLMFFVAESITADIEVFMEGVAAGCRSIKAGGLFIAAFMAQSSGYDVGSVRFPAVSIDMGDVEAAIAAFVEPTVLERLQSPTRVREGYGGMILLVGTRTG